MDGIKNVIKMQVTYFLSDLISWFIFFFYCHILRESEFLREMQSQS